jgi:hypothetical protein
LAKAAGKWLVIGGGNRLYETRSLRAAQWFVTLEHIRGEMDGANNPMAAEFFIAAEKGGWPPLWAWYDHLQETNNPYAGLLGRLLSKLATSSPEGEK